MEMQGIQKRQEILKRKNEVKGLTILNLKTYYKATEIKTAWENKKRYRDTGIMIDIQINGLELRIQK